MTVASLPFFVSSFASVHGADSSMYLFPEPIISQTELSILLYSSLSINLSTLPYNPSAALFNSVSKEDSSEEGDGICPSKYFSIMEIVLLRRLPISFARSALILFTIASLEKSPSSPSVTSRIRKYRKGSTPNSFIISNGLTTLPTLFDIFSPSTVHQPCANMLFGGSISSALSMVDQYTECVVNISFPIRWKSAGHHLLNFSISVIKPGIEI